MRRWFLLTLVSLIACGPFFYQAPPTLNHYPERLPTKHWKDLFLETSPMNAALPNADELAATCARLPDELSKLAHADRLTRIDQLLEQNRSGNYSSRTANILHELHELAGDSETFNLAQTYLSWRIDESEKFPARPPAEKPWNMEDEDFEKFRQLHEEMVHSKQAALELHISQSPAVMLPNWKVQLAVFLNRLGKFSEASLIYADIEKQFPNHPRAEVATLMHALALLQESRASPNGGNLLPDQATRKEQLLEDAEKQLGIYISKYPKGRFLPDAHGWLGAVAFDRGNYGSAMKHQMDRLDLQPTREISRTVLRECDFIFEKLFARVEGYDFVTWFDAERDFDAATVGKHPLVARLFVQHALDPSAAAFFSRIVADNYSADRRTIDFLKQRTFRPAPFIKIALQKLGAELLKNSAPNDQTTLTLLAWSATESAEHAQALALLNQITDQPRDEALHAKAIVLQRLGKHQDAIAAFDLLEKSFPESPLCNDLSQRRALSYFQTGQAGKAIVAFFPKYIEEPKWPDLHPEHYKIQWCDTLLQFAPLEQIAAAIPHLPQDSAEADTLRNMIRARALSIHDFKLAHEYLSPQSTLEGGESNASLYNSLQATRLDETGWKTHIVPLEKLYDQLIQTSEASKIHLEIANHWFAHRGFITMPSLNITNYANSETEKQELLRRQNALQLGSTAEQIDTELDLRDEITHALKHALKAAESNDPAIAAAALELANECLFRRSEFSLYQRSRALETDATGLSKNLCNQLTNRFPESPEARRAVYYTFLPATGPWMPGDYNRDNSSRAIMSALYGNSSDRWAEEDQAVTELKNKIQELPQTYSNFPPEKPLREIRKDLEKSKAELRVLRRQLSAEDQVEMLPVTDRLDDLSAAASLNGITTTDFSNYANNRYEALPAIFKSLLDFKNRLATKVNLDGMDDGLVNNTIEGWHEFLATYPQSPKAEAASLRYLRLIARRYRGPVFVGAFYFPEAPILDGYKRIEIGREDTNNDPDRILAMVVSHEDRFPKNRYRSDLAMVRAGALIDLGKFSEATAILIRLMDDAEQGDLHALAAHNFCDIAQRLLEIDQRTEIITAFRNNPAALTKLRLLVNGDTFLSRLQPMMPWLEEKLAAR